MCVHQRGLLTLVWILGGSWTLLPKVANFAEGEHKRKIKAKCARLPDV